MSDEKGYNIVRMFEKQYVELFCEFTTEKILLCIQKYHSIKTLYMIKDNIRNHFIETGLDGMVIV